MRQPHARARHFPLAIFRLRGDGAAFVFFFFFCGLGPIESALRSVVADARRDDGSGARRAPHADSTHGLDDLEQDDDAPSGFLPRALGEHLEEELRVLDRSQERRASRVDPALGFPEALVAPLRGEGRRGEEVRVVGCEEGEEGLKGFGCQGRVGEAGAGEEVGEGAEGGFEGGDLGGVVADEVLVGGEPLRWNGGIGGGDAEAGGEGGR